MAVSDMFESFTEVGIKPAVIQNERGNNPQFLNSAWWISFGRGIILYSLSFFLIPSIAIFYNNPDLTDYMRIAFLSILFRSLFSVKAYSELKSLHYNKWVIIYHGGSFIGILTTIVLVYITRDVWGLIIGYTIENLARLLLSFILCPFRPNFNFLKDDIKSIIRYARGMLGIPILTFIFMRADIFTIGKLYSDFELGLYSMAVSLSTIPVRLISNLISQVLMPAFSSMQNDLKRINTTLLKITKMISIVVIPFLIFIFFYGKDVLHVIYGEVYSAVAIPYAIISSTAIIRLLTIPIVGIYLAIGQPEIHRFITIIRVLVVLCLIYPATLFFGLIGAASASLIAMIIGYVLQIFRLRGITRINLVDYSKQYINGVLISLFIIVIWIATSGLIGESPIISLIIGSVSILITYIFAVLIRNKNSINKLYSKIT
jgi:O-antigen/teichoic acid export membrane protein